MSIVICIAVIAGIFFMDFNIKKHVEASFENGEKREYLDGRIRLKKIHNTGFAGSVGHIHTGMVAAVSLIVTIIGVIVFVISMGSRGNAFVRAGLSFVLGGAFSNTYDRLKKRYVVDYLNFDVKCKWLSRLVFNVSDFCILIGALLTIFGTMR